MADEFLKKTVDLLNFNFGPGQQLGRIVEIQKQVQVFNPGTSLLEAYEYCGIIPEHQFQSGFAQYFETLKAFPSPVEGMNSHDLLSRTLQHNLEAATPLPVCFHLVDYIQDGFPITIKQEPFPPMGDEQCIIASLAPLPGEHDVAAPSGPKTHKQKS